MIRIVLLSELACFPQACDQCSGKRSGADTMLLGTTKHDWANRGQTILLFPQDESPNTLRSMHLMPTERHHAIGQPLNLRNQFSSTLGCVNVKQDICFRKRLPNLIHGLDYTSLVVYMHNTDQQRIFTDPGKNVIRRNAAVLTGIDKFNFKSLSF